MNLEEIDQIKYMDSTISLLGSIDNPVFIADEVGELLNLSKTRNAVINFDDRMRCSIKRRSAAGMRSVIGLTEYGFYNLLFTSVTPAAMRFKQWVAAELLPLNRRLEIFTFEQIIRDVISNENSNADTVSNISDEYFGGYVYFITAEVYDNRVKIGKSTNPASRLKNLQTGNPLRLTIRHAIKINDYHDLERTLHDICKDLRLVGEWFEMTESELNALISAY